MVADRFMRSKIIRQVKWNGRDMKFVRYKRDIYNQVTDEVDEEINIRGVFHEGGGYGGMLNIELYENDGARTVSKMKPMVLCMYEDGIRVDIDDEVKIGGYWYLVVEKNDVSNLGVAFEISLEINNGRLHNGERDIPWERS